MVHGVGSSFQVTEITLAILTPFIKQSEAYWSKEGNDLIPLTIDKLLRDKSLWQPYSRQSSKVSMHYGLLCVYVYSICAHFVLYSILKLGRKRVLHLHLMPVLRSIRSQMAAKVVFFFKTSLLHHVVISLTGSLRLQPIVALIVQLQHNSCFQKNNPSNSV